MRSIHTLDAGVSRPVRKCQSAFVASAWVAETSIRKVLTEAGLKALNETLTERIVRK